MSQEFTTLGPDHIIDFEELDDINFATAIISAGRKANIEVKTMGDFKKIPQDTRKKLLKRNAPFEKAWKAFLADNPYNDNDDDNDDDNNNSNGNNPDRNDNRKNEGGRKTEKKAGREGGFDLIIAVSFPIHTLPPPASYVV